MDYRVIDHSVCVIAYKKNNISYAMTCAWAMMVDYDKIVCLLGEQSVTGKNICKGDKIGVSTLAIDQKNVALKLGDNHSDKTDKLNGIKYSLNETAITIDSSKTEMLCEVIDILHLNGIESDNLLYLRILDKKQNDKIFLHMEDF